MNDKLFINVYVPYLNSSYDMFIPYNEKIEIIVKDILKMLFDISAGRFDVSKKYALINRETGEIYSKNAIVIDTNIRNGQELLLIKEGK